MCVHLSLSRAHFCCLPQLQIFQSSQWRHQAGKHAQRRPPFQQNERMCDGGGSHLIDNCCSRDCGIAFQIFLASTDRTVAHILLMKRWLRWLWSKDYTRAADKCHIIFPVRISSFVDLVSWGITNLSKFYFKDVSLNLKSILSVPD